MYFTVLFFIQMSVGGKMTEMTNPLTGETKMVETFNSVLNHAGVASWREFPRRFPNCDVAAPGPEADPFTYWVESQRGEWTDYLNTNAKIREYNKLTVEQRRPYLDRAWPSYLDHVKAMTAWYHNRINQWGPPYVRKSMAEYRRSAQEDEEIARRTSTNKRREKKRRLEEERLEKELKNKKRD